MAIQRLDNDERGISNIDTPSGEQNMLIINESGLYSLVLSSRKPEAKRFKKWVTSEVQPSIRKTGEYQIKENQPIKTDLSTQTLKASKLFPPLFRVAKLINCDKNAAAISANRIVRKLTDINLLEEFGHTHLEAKTKTRSSLPRPT